MLNILIGIVVAIISVICYTKYQQMVGQLKSEREKCADLYNKTILAEQGKTKAEAELDYLQKSIVQLMQRPVVATMTDLQVNNIIGALVQYASAAGPEKMN